MSKQTKCSIIDGIFYFVGAVLIAFGIVMIIRSNLGTSPWDTLHVALAEVTPLTVGMAIILVTFSLTFFIIVVRKSHRYLFMVIPIVLVGLLIDFFDLVVFDGFVPEGYAQLGTFFLGLFTVPFGAAMHIVSRFPAGVFDEFMLVLMKLFKTRNMILVRILMEATPVLIGVLLTGYFKGNIGSLYFGTVIFVVLAGPLLRMYIKLIRGIETWKSIY